MTVLGLVTEASIIVLRAICFPGMSRAGPNDMIRNYHIPTTSALSRPPIPLIRHAETPQSDDVPLRDLMGDVCELWGLLTLGKDVPVVEQTGPVTARTYRHLHGKRFLVYDALDHVRGSRRFAIGAGERVKHVVFDVDFGGWPASHRLRVELIVRFCREVLEVEPVVLESPRQGHHVYALWPALVPRDAVRECVVEALGKFFQAAGEKLRRVEVRPSGQALRFPCGSRQFLVDASTLTRVPGTYKVVSGKAMRSVGPLVSAFLERLGKAVVPACALDKLLRRGQSRRSARHQTRELITDETKTTHTHARAPDHVTPDHSSCDRILRGPKWRDAVYRLLTRGIERYGTRNRDLGRLAFHLRIDEGLSPPACLLFTEQWLTDPSLDHKSNSLDFVGESMRDMARWLDRLEKGIARGELIPRRSSRSSHSAHLDATDKIYLPPASQPGGSQQTNATIRLREQVSHPTEWGGQSYDCEATSLLAWCTGQDSSREIVLSFRDVESFSSMISTARRRYIGSSYRHMSVMARRHLQRLGVLTRVRGWRPERGHAAAWRVDTQRARRIWKRSGNVPCWDLDRSREREPVRAHQVSSESLSDDSLDKSTAEACRSEKPTACVSATHVRRRRRRGRRVRPGQDAQCDAETRPRSPP